MMNVITTWTFLRVGIGGVGAMALHKSEEPALSLESSSRTQAQVQYSTPALSEKLLQHQTERISAVRSRVL